MGQGISIDDVLAIAVALPEVTPAPYGDDALSLKVRGRGFAYLNERHLRALVKATLAERAALVATEPDVFTDGWSSGRFGWVRVQLAGVDADEFAELLTEAWRMTAPKRLVAAHDGAAPPGARPETCRG